MSQTAEGVEAGLPLPPTPEQQHFEPKKAVKCEPIEGNSDIQQLVQVLKQSMLGSSEVSEARRNARAPRVYSVGQNFKTWLSQFLRYANLVRIRPSDRLSVFAYTVGPAGV